MKRLFVFAVITAIVTFTVVASAQINGNRFLDWNQVIDHGSVTLAGDTADTLDYVQTVQQPHNLGFTVIQYAVTSNDSGVTITPQISIDGTYWATKDSSKYVGAGVNKNDHVVLTNERFYPYHRVLLSNAADSNVIVHVKEYLK